MEIPVDGVPPPYRAPSRRLRRRRACRRGPSPRRAPLNRYRWPWLRPDNRSERRGPWRNLTSRNSPGLQGEPVRGEVVRESGDPRPARRIRSPRAQKPLHGPPWYSGRPTRRSPKANSSGVVRRRSPGPLHEPIGVLDLIFRFDIGCALTRGLARDSLNGAIRVRRGFPASANVYKRVADVELNDAPRVEVVGAGAPSLPAVRGSCPTPQSTSPYQTVGQEPHTYDRRVLSLALPVST